MIFLILTNSKNVIAGGDDDGGFGMPNIDPDIMSALGDPEVATALQDCMTNPSNIMKYANNPKVMNLLKKMSSGMGGGMGGMGGFPGMPNMGGMGGFPGGFGGPPEAPKSDSKPKDNFDDGLD